MPPTSVAFSALLPPKGNPRRSYDKKSIEGLAQSIKTDGLIHNLTVRPESGGKYRVVAGKRRFLALQYLNGKGEIDRTYKVSVRIRAKATQKDLDRLATVENVQREALDPIDEAEAFARLLQKGEKIEDVAVDTGVSAATIRRRLALADLAPEVKRAVREKAIVLSVAEALTLAAPAAQKTWLKELKGNGHIDGRHLRSLLLEDKPSVAMALFPIESYTGGVSRDLFAAKETTYFDDRVQFLKLQGEAVEGLAAEYCKGFAWVDKITEQTAPWWEYREARKKEKGGVVIHFAPTGRVEIRKNLIRHPVETKTAQATHKAAQTKERAEWTKPTLRYANAQMTAAMQGALLGNPRKAKEVAATLLLTSARQGSNVRLMPHEALRDLAKMPQSSKAYAAIEEMAGKLLRMLDPLDRPFKDAAPAWDQLLHSGATWSSLTAGIRSLGDQDLEALIGLCIVLCFGTASMDRREDGNSPSSVLAREMDLNIRAAWVPDAVFLNGLRREQLIGVAQEAGAAQRLPRLESLSKKGLVDGLARYFERTADPGATLDETDAKGRTWLPTCMSLPNENVSEG